MDTRTQAVTSPERAGTDGLNGTGVDCRYSWGGAAKTTRWAIYCGSALDVLPQIRSDTFDCVVTSPPYFWLRDYGNEAQLGHEPSVAEYVARMTEVFTEVRRVLKPTGLCFLNIGDTYYNGRGKQADYDPRNRKRRFGYRLVNQPGGLGIGLQPKSLIGIPWRVAISLSENGWTLRHAIIWHRRNHLKDAAKDRPSRSYEEVFMLSKDRFYHFDSDALGASDGNLDEDIWSIPCRIDNIPERETTPFPYALAERCLAIGCPPRGRVLDPFSGSGTTLSVAMRSGRSAVGIDINRSVCAKSAAALDRLGGA